MMNDLAPVHVIGGGLAGCEAAFQIASMNVPVVLHEMRPTRKLMRTTVKALPNWFVPILFGQMMQRQMLLVFCIRKCGFWDR